MYESRIAADRLTVAAIAGFPPEIDALAGRNLSGHGFLRAAWYRGSGQQQGRTLLVRRGEAANQSSSGGEVIAAIPTVSFGPAAVGARKISGSYWPFRTPLIAPDCSAFELAQALEHPAARSLGPVWRMGPSRMDDPATMLMVAAARLAGWTVLTRPAGTSWMIDLAAARAENWPRASTARKLRSYWRKLEELGTPRWRHVRGDAWDASVLEGLGLIEAQSWIARSTDGSGAKFISSGQRAVWQHALTDPVIAQKLAATILMLDDRPVAFSFDLDDGPVRYGIACSYVEDLKRCNIGKLTNYRALEDAIVDGQTLMDMGVGDSGYKREMGAAEGCHMADLLFVRSRLAARLLANVWGTEITPPTDIALHPQTLVRG